MKEVVGGFKILTQDCYGNSKTILVAGIIILAVTSTNRNFKIFGYQQTVDSFFSLFSLDSLYSWKFRIIVFMLLLLCHVLVFGWSVCGRSAGLLLCFIIVLFQVLFDGQVPDTGNGQVPDTGNGQVPDTGNGQVPDTGNGQVPDTGNVPLRASMSFTCLILRISYC